MIFTIMLIDSHCHLETAVKKGTLGDVLANAAAAGVERMITIGTAPADWQIYQQLAADHPQRISHTFGLHPCAVDDGWRTALGELEQLLQAGAPPRPVAIGEIGLDAFHLPKDAALSQQRIDAQKQAYAAQLELAAHFGLPVVIHSRGALADAIELLRASPLDPARAVFHCFSEGPDEMRAIRATGSRASFTGIVTYPKADSVRQALRLQGTDVLMLETDAPYLAPQQKRGQTNQPAYLQLIAEKVAEVLAIDTAELAALTSRNCREFFS